MRATVFLLIVCCSAIHAAGEHAWNFSERSQMESIVVRNGALISGTADGVLSLAMPATRGKWPPSISFGTEHGPGDGKGFRVEFQARSDSPAKLRITISESTPPFTHLSSAVRKDISPEWRDFKLDFKLSRPLPAKLRLNLPIMVFDEYANGSSVNIRQLRISAIPGQDNSRATAPTAVKADWKALDTSDLYIKAGSALDLYSITSREAAGNRGRLIVNPRGQLAFESDPASPVRFFSVQLMPYRLLADSSREQLAEFAAATARQGYNMVRLHFLDDALRGMRGAALKITPRYSLPEKPDDITFDPEILDAFFFLAAEFKKHGVYLNLDFMTSFVGYDNGALHNADKNGDYNSKVQLLINPMFRRNWIAGVNRLLNTPNPYTGMTLRDDPALALATCVNEQEILISFRDYGQAFQPRWIAWLQQRHGTYGKLYQAWQGQCGNIKLREDGDFSSVPPVGEEAMKDSPAGRDMALFCGELEEEMSLFFVDALKTMDYPGLYSSWNMRTRLCTVPARSHFPFITMNGYHAHPRYGKETFVTPHSSLEWGGSSFNSQAVARFIDRPFVNTEFGLVFWNRFRHEQGLLYGAGAALQNWSGITCHSSQVQRVGDPIKCFAAGYDPVIRASELVSAFAFLRGDVKSSTHSIEIDLDRDYIFAGRGMRTIDSQLSRLWAVCKIGISFGPKRYDPAPVLRLRPGYSSAVGGGLMFTTVEESGEKSELSAAIAQLRKLKALPEGNISDPDKGIFQSDTGELILDTTAAEMRVSTPRLESAILKSDKTVKLGGMTVNSCDVPAGITLVSLDPKQALSSSPRLLLVFSTDARNHGMSFVDPGTDTRLKDWGELPVMVRTGKLDVEIASGRTLRCFPLRLNGSRAGEIPVTRVDGKLRLNIDTAALKESGPTPVFELAEK